MHLALPYLLCYKLRVHVLLEYADYSTSNSSSRNTKALARSSQIVFFSSDICLQKMFVAAFVRPFASSKNATSVSSESTQSVNAWIAFTTLSSVTTALLLLWKMSVLALPPPRPWAPPRPPRSLLLRASSETLALVNRPIIFVSTVEGGFEGAELGVALGLYEGDADGTRLGNEDGCVVGVFAWI